MKIFLNTLVISVLSILSCGNPENRNGKSGDNASKQNKALSSYFEEQTLLWTEFFKVEGIDDNIILFDSSLITLSNRKLYIDNVEIPIKDWTGAQSGLATCDGNERVIYFAKTPTVFTDFYRYTFFREHEFAHHKLNHISCPLSNPPKNPNFEFEADSLAARFIIHEIGRDGQDLILITAGALSAIPNGGNYKPPLRERAFKLVKYARDTTPDLSLYPTLQKTLTDKIAFFYLNSNNISEYNNNVDSLLKEIKYQVR